MHCSLLQFRRYQFCTTTELNYFVHSIFQSAEWLNRYIKALMDPFSQVPRKPRPPPLDPEVSWRPAGETHLLLLKDGRNCDVTFIVGPNRERIPCHQLFLRARSAELDKLFSESWNEGSREVWLPDMEPKIFRAFLEFMYVDTFVANMPEALELLQLAHLYDVRILERKCEELLKSEVKSENALQVFRTARKYNKTELMEKAGEIMARSLDTFSKSSNFNSLDKITLRFLLQRDDLRMREVEIFRFAIKWGKHQLELHATEN